MSIKNFKVLPGEYQEWLHLALNTKEEMSKERIRSWYESWDGKVYVSFSGGKDSTVLLHLARSIFPDIKAVFINTGLEYPEVVKFVKETENVDTVRGDMPFNKVVENYGYPVVSKEISQKLHDIMTTKSDFLRSKRLHGDEKGNGKISEKWKFLAEADFKISHQCCAKLKKNPVKKYEKNTGLKPIVGMMAVDSRLREQQYLTNGCNSFDSKRPTSSPIAFWTEGNVWEYIKKYNVPYSRIYDMGYTRTGCMFCMFGVHMEREEENRFQRMKHTHPTQYNYCINTLGIGKVLDAIKIEY